MPYLNLDPYPGYTSTQGPSQRGTTSGAAGAGTIPGAAPFSYSPAYGGIPQVSDPTYSAGQAIAGNLGNLGALYGLTTGTSGASAAGAAAQYAANLPGYAGLTSQASQNILSDLQGQVSPDVVNMLAQQAAQRGVGFGAGAPNTNAALLAALGKTSMGLQAQGQQELTAAIGRTPVGPMFNPATMQVSPDVVQQARQAANLYRSAPVPSAAAGAAISAAGAGVGAGYGARGGASGLAPSTGTGPWESYSGGALPSQGTGITYGGQTYYGGATPGSAATNWSDWASGLPGYGSTQQGVNSYEDWFNSFGLTDDYGLGAPAGTVSGADSSSFDPYADITGGAYGG